MTLFLLSFGVAYLAEIGTASIEADVVFRRALTFAERVAYQHTIERVCLRHRIWPKDNPGVKPALDALISREQIERKVEDYLRESQIVTSQRGSPITASELQAEMERMASHTRQPDALRELFEALGNDPFVIAECLARPILAERMLVKRVGGSSSSQLDCKMNWEAITNSSPSALTVIARGAGDPSEAAYRLPEIAPLDCDDSWTSTTTLNVPDARWGHVAIWTGNEMVIWGGSNSTGGLNTGGKYNPALDSWAPTSTTNAPVLRAAHTAVWTGTEVIVWGGNGSGVVNLNSGGRYNPITDAWTATSTANAPAARASHTAAWTGSEMIIWGGYGCDRNCNLNSGGRYNPSMDSWLATSAMNAPAARWNHKSVWTGRQMIVWGGSDDMNYLHTGAKYDPGSDSWTPTSLTYVPLGRYAFTGVWTGSEMIVWGGVDETFNDCNTGGRYNPSTDSWIATNLSNAPSPRDSQTAVWTGSQMTVWAGAFLNTNLNSGGRYNPNTDNWTQTTTANAPSAREDHTAVWTGTQMIAWGGLHYPSPFLNTGGIYCAQALAPVLQNAFSRKMHGQFGIFDVALPLTGTPGIECRSGGTTNDYSMMVTFSANVSINGNPQAAVTSGIGTIGSGGVSNGGRVLVAENLVTIPLTNVANAQTIQVTLYG